MKTIELILGYAKQADLPLMVIAMVVIMGYLAAGCSKAQSDSPPPVAEEQIMYPDTIDRSQLGVLCAAAIS